MTHYATCSAIVLSACQPLSQLVSQSVSQSAVGMVCKGLRRDKKPPSLFLLVSFLFLLFLLVSLLPLLHRLLLLLLPHTHQHIYRPIRIVSPSRKTD